MRLKHITYYIWIIILLASTGLAMSQNGTPELKKIKAKRLSKRVMEQYFDYQNLTYKMSAEVSVADKTHHLVLAYRNIKDSVIWINISHKSGLPVARFLITPDSTKFLNRMDKKYMLLSNNEIVKKFGYDLDFDMIQSIFLARLINLDPEKDVQQTYSKYKVYHDQGLYLLQNIKKKKVKRLAKRNKIDDFFFHKVYISANFLIQSLALEDNTNYQKIAIEYSEYKTADNKTYPKLMKLDLKAKNKQIAMDIKLKKAKFDSKKLNTPFKIPSKYAPASITKE